MTAIKIALIGLLVCSISFFAIEGGLLLRASRLQLTPTVNNLNQLVNNMNTTITKTDTLEDKLSVTADKQTEYWNKTQTQVYKLIDDTKLFVGRTDFNLNGDPYHPERDALIPAMERTLNESTDLQKQATEGIKETTAKVNEELGLFTPGITAFNQAAIGAAEVMGDPAIHESFLNIAGSTANLVPISADVKASSESLAASAKDIQLFIHRETTPVRGTLHLIESFLKAFGPTAVSVGAAVK